jgi:hypothetical protein
VLTAQATKTRTIHEGDVEIDPDKQAAAPPPSLRNPGEQLPDDHQNAGVMRPVQMPKPHTDDQPGANPDEQQQTPANDQATKPANSQSPPANGQQPPSNSSQQQSAPSNSSSPPTANPSQFITTSSVSKPASPDAEQPN